MTARLLTARTTDGRTVEFEDSALNLGAEKIVFRSRDRSQVVAFFHGTLSDRRARADRLARLVARYNPALGAHGAFWRGYFCWPDAVIDADPGIPVPFLRDHSLAHPVLGLVVPAYRANFFFRDRFGQRQEKEVKWFTGRKARAFVPAEERGTLLTRLQAATRLARAVRRLHFAGLAHSDLSNKNVLVDLKGGDACVIDIDSLVVPGVAPPTVLGTPGYLAPETLAHGTPPSIRTDLHALAVLIYQLLLGRHPLEGRKVHSARSPEEDERLAMGANALWVEHPLDRSNPPLEPVRVPYTALGPWLAPLFERAFVAALHHPERRPDAAEWETALYRTLDAVHPAPDGQEWMVLAPGMPLAHPGTGAPIGRPVPVLHYATTRHGARRAERRSLTLFHHLVLHDWHLDPAVTPNETADRTPRGYVARHAGAWWLVNGSGTAWTRDDGGTVPHGSAVALTDGLTLHVGPDGARTWTVEFLMPTVAREAASA